MVYTYVETDCVGQMKFPFYLSQVRNNKKSQQVISVRNSPLEKKQNCKTPT